MSACTAGREGMEEGPRCVGSVGTGPSTGKRAALWTKGNCSGHVLERRDNPREEIKSHLCVQTSQAAPVPWPDLKS